MQIQDNVFIITGGASGLGASTARMIVAAGGKVVLADVQVEAGQALAAELGGVFVKCDVTSEADGQAVVAAAVALGTLRGLVNCAGVAPAVRTVGKEGAHSLELFQRVVSINLVGTFNMARLTLPMARDLSRSGIRVMTIAPGIFETPMLMGMPTEVQEALGQMVPFPPRLGKPSEYAQLAKSIIENVMLNGETIRLDGAIRMQPK